MMSDTLTKLYSIYRTNGCYPYLPELDYQDVVTMSEDITPPSTITAVPVESMLYYYGNISRETAEWILWDRGCQDGMYLIRESNTDYVLSLCYQKSVLHYRIKKLSTGEVGLCGVPRQRFPGPVELVEGVEGLACKPVIPCNKSLDSVLPLTHWGVTEEEIRKAMLQKAREWGIDEDKLDSSLTENYSDIKLLITKTLHEIQPWFHGRLSRLAAEQHIEESGHKDGKFLVRERNDSSYALCLSHSGRIKHYKIDVLPSGEFAIQDGQRFPSIMALVSHYTLFSDGLWCALNGPCLINRTSENSSQNRNSRNQRDSPSMTENRSVKVSNNQGPVSSEKSKSSSGCQSPAIVSGEKNSSAFKSSKLLSGLNQRGGLFTKLVASVAPQMVSQNSQSSSVTSSISNESLEGNNEQTVSVVGSPPTSSYALYPTPPNTRKSSVSSVTKDDAASQDMKKGRIQKASSFDLLPAFFSLFLYGDSNSEGDKKNKRKSLDNSAKRILNDGEINKSVHNECNGIPQEHNIRSGGDEVNKVSRSAPIPAPRLSLTRKLSHDHGPVYANRDVLTTTGRSVSLGDSSTTGSIPEEDEGCRSKLQKCDHHMSPPFIRSASSPSVVSHLIKPKPQPCPRQSQLSSSPDCNSINTDSLPTSPLTIDSTVLTQNGSVSPISNVKPVPRPRKKFHNQEGNDSDAMNSCASSNNTSSPIFTELSEQGQELSPDEPLYAEIDPSLVLPDSYIMEDSECIAATDGTGLPLDNTTSLAFRSPSLSPRTSSPFIPIATLESLSQRDTLISPTESNSPSYKDDDEIQKELQDKNVDNPVYDTLSVGTDVIDTFGGNEELTSPLQSSNTSTTASSHSNEIFNRVSVRRTLSREESELAYHTLRRYRRGPINLDPKSIILKEKIGSGNFGEVLRGVFATGPMEVQFALKMLKNNSVPNQKTEILKEAQMMAALDHPHIVRLIGVCEGESFMLVMELAPLGPLNKYLRCHRDMPVQDILYLMMQVSMAMEYLENKQFVHRDLAARNVLLVNESFAKISDFGMSRALGLGKEYYRAEVAGKWPLKWYAPECIYYFKFSTKSDVWSYGVSLWEALSYGEKPYQGLTGREILEMFERNERLAKPANCPNEIYDIMWKCWQYRAEDRPTFAEVHQMMKEIVGGNR
ncbi:tyrosine-protein kinase Shark-like isoform X3 [Centruroides vittatus]|uniref:tyrosine-protein kinase Shark-like isoform X3 n=1 Tax=Centruroides vittatus TaxID=120091 RepID=UPI0035108418